MPALRNNQHEMFCQEYLVDLHQEQAAIRAGYKPSNARSQASRLMAQTKIRTRIDELKSERAERTAITTDRVLEEMSILAHSNITDYILDDSGNVTVRDGVDPIALRAIASVKHRTRTAKDGTVIRDVEIRLWNKPDIVRLEGLHLSLFSEKHEHKHTGEVRFVPPTIAQQPPGEQSPGEQSPGEQPPLTSEAGSDDRDG